MYPLILEHLTSHDLPAKWAKQLPPDLMFSVIIVTEKTVPKQLKTKPTDTPLFGIWHDYEITQYVGDYIRTFIQKDKTNNYTDCI